MLVRNALRVVLVRTTTVTGGMEAISLAQAIKLSIIANISSAIVRRKENSADTMKSLLSYVSVPKEQYGVCFVDMRMMDHMDDMRSLHVLADRWRVMYERYSRAKNMIFEHN